MRLGNEGTFGARKRGNVARLGTDLVENGSFDPRKHQVRAFAIDDVLNTREAGVFDGAVSTVNCRISAYSPSTLFNVPL